MPSLTWIESVRLDAKRLLRFTTTRWQRLTPPPLPQPPKPLPVFFLEPRLRPVRER